MESEADTVIASALRHPQLQQLGNLLLLVLLARWESGLALSIGALAVLTIAAVAAEWFYLGLTRRRFPRFVPYSAANTAIGTGLMLAATQFWIYGVAVAAGLLQKHLLRPGGSHLFNPSNFAVVTAMTLFYERAHILSGQLGTQLWPEIGIALLGLAILFRVRRWLIPPVFAACYLAAQQLLVVGYDPTLLARDVPLRFASVSFLVFTLFMLTDPRTTPRRYLPQALFAATVALIAAWLDRLYGFRVQHLFLALFLSTPWVALPRIMRAGAVQRAVWGGVVLATFAVLWHLEHLPPYHFEMAG